MEPLPPTFAATRDGLHRLACYVMAPARMARTGRIGLRPRATASARRRSTTARASSCAARSSSSAPGPRRSRHCATAPPSSGIELSADPGVGDDLPPFEPDADLAVDAAASRRPRRVVRVRRRRTGAPPCRRRGGRARPELWPEHFDLAVVVTMPGGAGVNVGFSPGDAYSRRAVRLRRPARHGRARRPVLERPVRRRAHGKRAGRRPGGSRCLHRRRRLPLALTRHRSVSCGASPHETLRCTKHSDEVSLSRRGGRRGRGPAASCAR